jgi:hypothetical protein
MKRVVSCACAVSVLLVGGLLFAPRADAHQPGQTLVTVRYAGTVAEPTLHLTGEITLDRLDLAYHLNLSADPASSIAKSRQVLTKLIGDRVSLLDHGGAAWSVTVGDMQASRVDGYVTLKVDLVAKPPTVGTAGKVDLRWGVVTDVIYSHKVFIASMNAQGDARLIGTLAHHEPVFVLTVDSTSSQPLSPWLFGVGFDHFRSGVDHLVFVCIVALGAAQRTVRRRATAYRLALLTGAFTVGHSLSLAMATMGWLTLPVRVVETAIAGTILLAAVHTLSPVVPARAEVVITLIFGFIHGFGFAGTLEHLSLRGADLVMPLLTFNVGLEAAQLLALAITAAQVAVIARSRRARNLIAIAVGLVAVSWIIERGLNTSMPVDVAMVLRTPEHLAVVLLGVAAIVLATRTRATTHQIDCVGDVEKLVVA